MRLFVTLLVALPQLVPTGACLCGMDLCARSSEPKPALTATIQEISLIRTCASGCCHKYKHRDSAEEATHGEVPPVEPSDRPHEPGCPAEVTVSDDARVAERNDPPEETPKAGRIETLPDSVLLSDQSIADTSADPHLPIPIYLAHCALLI